MNTAEAVSNRIEELKKMVQESGMPLSEAVFETAKLCVGWAYVFGAWGDWCDPENRRSRASDAHPTIVSACQVLNGKKSSCSGCKWYPEGKRTRCFDCRGFTRWCLKQFGLNLEGSGCTSQWNTASNWRAKGKISDGMPEDTLVCLFYSKDGKEKTWEHTGFGYKGHTCECSSGVQYFENRNRKWTHWAVPVGIDGDLPIMKPTLRKGSTGEYVYLLQGKLAARGYDLGKSGIDGKYGPATMDAVKAFQKDNGLVADGVCGPKTWEAIDDTPTTLYAVMIPHLTKSKAESLVSQYVGAVMTEEET